MASDFKCDLISKIRLPKSMRIYLKNIYAEFHPDPIWNDGAIGFLKKWRNKNNNMNNNNKMSSPWQRYGIISWSKTWQIILTATLSNLNLFIS